MSTEPTPPSAPKPQLPPAAGTRPSLPQAPKLGLAGTKPAFKPEPAAAASEPAAAGGDPFATDTVARPATIPALQRPPSIGNAPGSVANPSATRAPFSGTAAPFAQTKLVPVNDEAPKWAGAVAGLGLAVSIAAVVLLFLELKPTL